MRANIALIVSLFFSLSLAAPLETRADLSPTIPQLSHARRSVVPGGQVIHIKLALSLDGASSETAAQALEYISNPNSATYGQHWSRDEVVELFAPSKHKIREVAQWLVNSGIPRSSLHLSSDRTHLSFGTTVSKAESLLGAKFHKYSSGDNARVASDTYTLPQDISKHIDFILPAHEPTRREYAPESRVVPHKHGLNARSTREVDCFRYMTPHCLQKLYNMDDGTSQPASHPNNSLGFFTPSWSTWLPEDLDSFFSEFAPALVGHRPKVLPIGGGYRQFDIKNPSFNLEPNLDYQYSMALAHPLPVTNIQVGDALQTGNLNTALAAFDDDYCRTSLDANYDPVFTNATACGAYTPPRVIGVAYAWNEAWYSDAYAQRQCLEFLKLGLQGVTVVTGSGDRGPADQLGYCIDPHTGNYTAEEGHFASVFPASCPWVTTVGGTQLLNSSHSNATWTEGTPFPGETALQNNITNSGGGFSRLFPAPWYQADLTRAYLASPAAENTTLLADAGYFNPQGRGYPDLSAVALDYLISLYGGYRAVKGTSTVVPLVASMIAKINDARLHAGKSTVGFVNPVLYAHRETIMRDVETGANNGCGVDEAFPATKGWDAVTGLGAPDFEKLKEVYMSLP